ncbi:MAG: Fe-S cluster assembly ATPase SufC [bacterium]|nr:Fe-S cluster assembly ATPase SufC [bacterium]
MLKIENLCLSVSDKEILKNFNLTINDGEIHAIMGPNGIGKSSICKAIMGDTNYEIKEGSITFDDVLLNEVSTTERANMGLMLINQSPLAIEGVSNADMLRMALASKTGSPVDLYKFNKKIQEVCKKLEIPTSFIHRSINDGMSGGERKKNELMHMWMLEPKFLILDELDSGLDVDALRICANSIMEYYREKKISILIITHHSNILDIIKPDYVHIIKDKHISYTGDISTAKLIEKNGFNLDAGQMQ